MILDSSALVAIIMDEPGSAELLRKTHGVAPIAIGAPTLLETMMVLAGRSDIHPAELLEPLLHSLGAEVIPFTREHASIALRAFLLYGKGRHPAALNFGDCLAYAVAAKAGEPLLFKGGDFSQTRITPA